MPLSAIADAIDVEIRQMLARALLMPEAALEMTVPLGQYGMTSIDLIDVVVQLEARHRIQFDPAAMKDLTGRALSDNVRSCLAIERALPG